MDEDGCLRRDFTEDGCHPNEKAYTIWAFIIRNAINVDNFGE